MRPAVVTATANPSRPTRPQSSGKARKDIEGLALPQNQLGRYGLFARPVLVEQTLQDLLRVAVWCFFANWLLQSAVVGWEESRRVAPLEQLGGTMITGHPLDRRWAETRVVLRGIWLGRDTASFNMERTSPEMFTKVNCTEVRSSPAPPAVGQDRQKMSRDNNRQIEEAPMLFCEYAAPAFAHLRAVYGMSSSDYRKSFREGSKVISHASNSKSVQSFMFSEDGKYMLKTASESELESMMGLLPKYAEHVTQRRGSLISRFYGIYRVTNPNTKRSTIFMASSNVFSTERRLQERYDLKGSVIGRRTRLSKAGAVKHTTVLKDVDLAESAGGKLCLAAGCKERLLAELTADADFLAVHGIMDYSLLVGVHRSRVPQPAVLAVPLAMLSVAVKPVWAVGCFVLRVLPGGAWTRSRRPQVGAYPGREPGVVYYVGIIDVLQRYNVWKMLERGVKGVVYNRHHISAVPPQEYRDRFVDFIDRITE